MLKIAYSETYPYKLPHKRSFSMGKYELIPQQLLHEGIITADNLFTPSPWQESYFLWTHDKSYWEKVKNFDFSPQELKKIGLEISPKFIERSCHIMQGAIEVALFALKYGVSMNCAGGSHHAYRDKGEAFCLLNDFAIASNYLLNKGLVNNILIVDLDVHQGNGTAKIFENEPRVFTFSMHCAENYPEMKEKSDLDVAIPAGSGDEVYLTLLQRYLPSLIDKVKPDIVFYLAGVDILAADLLGKLSCTIKGCQQRDEYVFKLCKDRQIPVAVGMGGGYSAEFKEILIAHCNTFKTAQTVFF